MQRRHFLGLAALALIGYELPAAAQSPRVLTTQFTCTATVPAAPAGTKALNVWLPIPSDSPWQTITNLTVSAPMACQITTETHYSNRMVYLHDTQPGKPLRVTVQFTVARSKSVS